jgi:hypothetical protein
VQPIDGTRIGIDPLVSTTGHRLVPLIYSAGSDASYDVYGFSGGDNESAFDFDYAVANYDPFNYISTSSGGSPYSVMNCLPAEAMPQGVVLEPSDANGDRTFVARRLGEREQPTSTAFQGIGSERDLDRNGTIESLDNIHNHDLTR